MNNRSSLEYWRKREKEHIDSMHAKEPQYEEQMSKIYSQSMHNIQTEINAFYARYATKEGITMQEAHKRVDTMDVEAFSEKARKYVKEKDFSDQANKELKLYNATMRINRLELLKSKIGLELVAMGNDTEKYTKDTLTVEAWDEAKRQAGILGTSIDSINDKSIRSIVESSYHVHNDSGSYQNMTTFSERIWGNNESVKRNLDTILTQAIIGGKHPTALAPQLQKQFGASQKEAIRLIRTESSRVQSQIGFQSYKNTGVTQYEWVAEPGACPICSALDGKVFNVEGAEIGNPGHPMYPMHPSCRCATVAHFDENAYQDWLNHLDTGETTEEWEAKDQKNEYAFKSAATIPWRVEQKKVERKERVSK